VFGDSDLCIKEGSFEAWQGALQKDCVGGGLRNRGGLQVQRSRRGDGALVGTRERPRERGIGADFLFGDYPSIVE